MKPVAVNFTGAPVHGLVITSMHGLVGTLDALAHGRTVTGGLTGSGMQEPGTEQTDRSQTVFIPSGGALLEGELIIPQGAPGVVLFAHGSGSGRHSPRNQYVARVIRDAGIGTLLFDLLTHEEEAVDIYTRHLRFDINLLAERLVNATDWLSRQSVFAGITARNVGYFGASTGGGAALVAAALLGARVGAVVSRGGRPDLAGDALPLVLAPTLLIVGGHDEPVIELNEEAYARLHCKKEMQVIPGATHLFEEPGTLEEVARLAAAWFNEHLKAEPRAISVSGGSYR